MPLVSIVMRSMNDIAYIERTLQAISEQNFTDYELVNVDSGSTDGTYELIGRFNSGTVYQIKPEDYIPGKVLNAAISKCAGEIIVFNNSDCVPQNSDWLGNLIKPLLGGNDRIAAAFGNQLPRPDAKPLVRKDNLRAFGDGSTAAQWGHFFSLATSAAPKKLLLEKPFAEDIQYSEDVEWSYRMKQQGYQLIYVSDAIVEHSHNYTLSEVWKRFYNEGLADGRIYGSSTPFFLGFMLPCAAEIMRDLKYLLGKGKLAAIPDGVIYRLKQRYATWRGRRDYFKKLKNKS